METKMTYLFLINALISFLTFFLLSYAYAKNFNNVQLKKINNWLFLISIGALLLGILSLLWFFNILTYSESDMIIISASLVFTTFVMFQIMKQFFKNRKLSYFLITYLVICMVSYFTLPLSHALLFILSYLVFLMFCLYLLSMESFPRKASYAGIIYSCFSLILSIGTFFGMPDLYFVVISNYLFLVFLVFFIREFELYPIKQSSPESKPASLIISFIKYFIFVVIITNLVLVGTLVVHEFGHASTARYYDCQYRTVFFEKGDSPFTEVICTDASSKFYVTLAGMILPIILAIVLFMAGDSLSKSISLLMFGFNLILITKDSLEINFSKSLVFSEIYIGIVLVICGIVFLAKYKFDQN